MLTPTFTARASSNYGVEVLYAGYCYEQAIGLYHVRHRVYHPAIGAWGQRDPIAYAGGMSLLRYVGANPLRRRDSFGLVVYRGNEAAIVSFIANFTLTDTLIYEVIDAALEAGAEEDLGLEAFWDVAALLGEIAVSANPAPSATYFSWAPLLDSKEFRAFMRTQVEVCCTRGSVSGYRVRWHADNGYTPMRPFRYDKAEGTAEYGVAYANAINSQAFTSGSGSWRHGSPSSISFDSVRLANY